MRPCSMCCPSAVRQLAPQVAARSEAGRTWRGAEALVALALQQEAGMPEAERATLHDAHARLCVLLNRLDDALQSRQQALACLQRVGDAVAIGVQLWLIAQLHWMRGDAAAGKPVALQAIAQLQGTVQLQGTAQLQDTTPSQAGLDARRELQQHVLRAYVTLASLALIQRRHGLRDQACGEGLANCEAQDIDLYAAMLNSRAASWLHPAGAP